MEFYSPEAICKCLIWSKYSAELDAFVSCTDVSLKPSESYLILLHCFHTFTQTS